MQPCKMAQLAVKTPSRSSHIFFSLIAWQESNKIVINFFLSINSGQRTQHAWCDRTQEEPCYTPGRTDTATIPNPLRLIFIISTHISTVFSFLVSLGRISIFFFFHLLQKPINVSLAHVFKHKLLPQWMASAFSLALTARLIALGQQIPGSDLWGRKRQREQQHIVEQQSRYAQHCSAYCQRLRHFRGHELSSGVKFSWGCVSKIHYFLKLSQISE